MRFGPFLSLLIVMSASTAAFAQADPDDHTPDMGERRAARILADEGLSAFQRGDYQGAFEKFDKAEKLVPAPTIAIQIARSLDKLGRLLEARERYEAIVAEELPRLAPFVHHKAQDDAAHELEALKPRIPSLSLHIVGPRADGITLLVDDKPADLAAYEGVDRAVDPGTHTVDIRRKDTNFAKVVKVAEGKHDEVEIHLPSVGTPGPTAHESSSKRELMRGVGWLSFGVGGAGLLVGTITGISAISTKSHLDDLCAKRKCTSTASYGVVDRYDALRATSTVSLVLGGAGVLAGALLFGTAPKEEKATAGIRPYVGLGEAGVVAEF